MGISGFLTVQRPLDYINLKQYCAIDGVTDDSAGFTYAYGLAANLGLALWHPGGTLLKGNDTLQPLVPIVGPGSRKAIIKLKNGANTDLFSGQTGSINLAASSGSSGVGTLHGFRFQGVTLDGNKANQTAGPSFCLRFYGYDYQLEDVVIRYGYSGGILSDWNGGSNIANSDNIEAKWSNVVVHDCGGENILFGGPHDTQMKNILSFNLDGLSHSHLFHIAPNASGIQVSNIHCYGAYGGSTVCGLVEAGYCKLYNAEFESTDFYGLVLLQPSTQFYGHVFASTGGGIKLGQNSGETPITNQILQSAGVTTYSAITNSRIDAIFDGVTGSAGCFKFPAGGAATNNLITAHTNQTAGVIYSGYADPTNEMHILQSGLTPDGTTAKGGIQQFNSRSATGYTVSDGNYNDCFNVNPYSNRRIELPNGAYIQPYTDAYATAMSALRFGTGAPSNAVGANGDFYFRVDTPGVANQRIYVKSAGAWVGIV